MLSIARHARVAALNRNDPHPPRFPMAASGFTFFDRTSAQNFMQLGLLGMVSAHGYPLTFRWNKNKVRPATREEYRQSRTLLIEGPGKMISREKILNILADNLTLNLVDSEEIYVENERTLIRLEFIQVRIQSDK